MTSEPHKADPEQTKKKQQRKRLLFWLSIVFIVLGLIYLIYWTLVGRFHESTDDAYVSGNLVTVMSQISGQVTKILTDETDLVVKGQPVVVLDKADASIALQNAESELAIITRQVNQLYQKVHQLRANVQIQQDNLEKAQEDYHRRQGLVVNKTISAEDLRHAQLAFDSATAAVMQAKQQLAATLDLVGNTDLYHHPQVQQAAVHVRDAYLNWARTTIYAPETGYVAKRPVEVGQQINRNTALMVIIPLNQVWVDANFKESQLRHIRIGQPADVVSDAYGGSVNYRGKVVGLSPGTGSAFDLLPPQNATGNWIKIVQRLPVRISVDAKQLEQYPLRIGLSVTVDVNTHDRKGLTLTQTAKNKVIYQTKDYSVDLEKSNQLIEQILRANAGNVTVTTDSDK